MRSLYLFLTFILFIVLFTPSCKKDATTPKSASKILDSLSLLKGDSTTFASGLVVVSMGSGDTITVSVPPFTDLTVLRAICVITGKTISPANGTTVNFSSPVVFTVTAEDGSQQKYTVIVNRRGVVYFGSSDNNFYALDAVLGKSLWQTTAGNWSYSDPTLAGGILYAGNIDDNMYALDAATGSVKWKFATNSTIESPPTVANGVVYFGSDDHTFYAVDAVTGQLKWKYYTNGNISTKPFVAGNVVYFGSDDSYVYALDAGSGALIWRYGAGSIFNASSPVVVNGILYIGCRNSNLYALDAATGAVKWTYFANNISLEQSSPTVAGGIVYIGGWYNTSDFSLAGSLYAVDATTGALKWTALTAVGIGSDPAVADSLVYITCDDNNLYSLKAGSGAVVWKQQILANGASPAVSGAMVYCGGGGTHYFYAFDANTGVLKWQFSVGNNGIQTSKPSIYGRTSL